MGNLPLSHPSGQPFRASLRRSYVSSSPPWRMVYDDLVRRTNVRPSHPPTQRHDRVASLAGMRGALLKRTRRGAVRKGGDGLDALQLPPNDTRGTSRTYRTKSASAEEAAWTRYLRPDLFVSWTDGTMILVDTTHRSLRESAASDPALFVQAARLVPRLAARALGPEAPPPMAPLDPEEALSRYWEEAGLEPPRAGELIERVRAAGSGGLYTDANPSNWLVILGVPERIDFGEVRPAHPLSDVAQLLGGSRDPRLRAAVLQGWMEAGGDEGVLADLPVLGAFSALCRLPFRSRSERQVHAAEAVSYCREAGLSTFAGDLAANLASCI
jgi:hypothetical protein